MQKKRMSRLSKVRLECREVLIRNALIERVEKEKEPIKKCYNCLAKCNPGKVPYCITKALIDAVKGDVENGLVFCGSNVGRINQMMSVHELMQELVS